MKLSKSKLLKFIFCCIVSVLLFVSCNEENLKAPQSLTISEGFKNPIGFYDSTPTFSWELPVSEDIKFQSAYQLIVASSEDLLSKNPDLWDSKKQNTAQSTFVDYKGAELQSRQKVFWQVRYWDQDERMSEWSPVNSFELGLLNNSDWKAKWTGLDTAKDSIKGIRDFLMHRPQYLRKGFEVSQGIASARLYITAKGVFDAHINGTDLSDDVLSPGWTPYNKRIETLTYNVGSLLKSGENVIGIELASGWHSGRISRGKAVYENYASPKVLCQLEIVLKDGTTQIIVSDETWTGTANGPIRLASIYDGEVYDAHFEIPNWTTTAFDDGSWKALTTETISDSVKLVPKRHETVTTTAVIEDPEIVSVTASSVIFNMKQNMVGVPSVKVPMKKGDTLTIRFSEMLLSDGTFYTTNYRSAKSTDVLGWTGDAQVISPTALFNFNTHAFWTAWLQSMRETQSEHQNGLVPFIIPDVLQNNVASSGWGDACVIIPWDLYNITGDKTVLEENYEMAKKWIGYYQSKTKDFIPNMHSFSDWLQPYPSKSGKIGNMGDTPKVFVNTAYFAHSAHLVSKIAGVLGKTNDQNIYNKLYQDIASAFEEKFFDENGRFKNKKQTQTSYLLAIYFDLLKPETKVKAQKHLLETIKKADTHLGTGFLGTPILPKVLDDMGEIDLMYKILFKDTYPSWFYSINQGATTMWERWNSFSKASGYNPQSMNSLNHYAYGAVGQWMYERIAGLAPLSPGYKNIRIAPVPNTNFLTSASASVNTPYGKASSSWYVEDQVFNLEAVIPPNTTANIHLPKTSEQNVYVNGTIVDASSPFEFKEKNNTFIILDIHSGTYQFQTKSNSND